jgi:hypothetical protein
MTSDLLVDFETGDDRRSVWVAGNGVVYYPFKYKQGDNPATTVTEYSMVLRLAEQYLIRAEARLNQGKLVGEHSAESDINVIRNRAGLDNTAAVTNEELMAAIEQERRIELFAEWGHRWLDLKRWDRATTVLDPIKADWLRFDMLYPIPQGEINKNNNLNPQNTGY